MSDRFFTFMVIPEKGNKVRKLSLPTAYLQILAFVSTILIVLGFFVFFDYIHLLSQVAENKKLKLENHILRSEVQMASSKLDTLERSVGRLRSFAQKIRVISNLDKPGTSQMLEAPSGSQFLPSNVQEEEGGGISDPNASADPLRQQGEAELAEGTQPSEEEGLVDLAGVDIEDLPTDNILGELERITRTADNLWELTLQEESGYADLQEHIQDNLTRLRATPSILPARGWISSEFGYRMNPFSGRRTFHKGIDIANYAGTPVYAPADGVVTFAGPRGGYGNVVQISHGYGIVTRFGHNSRIVVKRNDRVRRGDKIAEIGSTGRSTAPHLHYEVVLRGKAVNPRPFILENQF